LTFSIEIRHSAQKQILAFPRKIQQEIARAIDGLEENPRPSDYRKLRGVELFRLRLGRYRIIYSINDKARQITILKVAQRREDTYRGL
jgi:mRNA interferase RelE/StbE